jgi:hypothetical protein
MLGHIHCTEAATGRGVGGASRKPAPIRYPSPPSECPEYHIRQQEPDIQMGGTSACGEVDRADRIIGSFRGQCPWERPASSMGRWMAVRVLERTAHCTARLRGCNALVQCAP